MISPGWQQPPVAIENSPLLMRLAMPILLQPKTPTIEYLSCKQNLLTSYSSATRLLAMQLQLLSTRVSQNLWKEVQQYPRQRLQVLFVRQFPLFVVKQPPSSNQVAPNMK